MSLSLSLLACIFSVFSCFLYLSVAIDSDDASSAEHPEFFQLFALILLFF